jgi:aldose 1-epimerase
MITSCQKESAGEINPENFDTIINGKQVSLYTLKNENGVTVHLTNYGARVVSVITPDKNGNMADIALGYDNIQSYLEDPMYLGCTVGRYANRIDEAKFSLDGKEYNLSKNERRNTLHGGKEGLDKKIWDTEKEGNTIIFSYLSPDGEEGYPGNLTIRVSYQLTENNELHIFYEAETDKPTIINLTNHAYWNLKGEGDSSILDHYFLINADLFTPIDTEWIPTGEITPVAGGPFDFTEGKKIGLDINAVNKQLKNGLGYDHNWVLNKKNKEELSFAAKLWEESTGRIIEVYTTEPGMQFYSGNFMDGSKFGKSGNPYLYRSGLAFETQHFPDSPNHQEFPSTILRPGEIYTQLTILKFKISDI